MEETTGRCTIDGYDIAYRRAGAGAPVLLVHGITTYSFIWRNVIPLLAQRFDVIALDLLGCGDSDKPLDVSYSLAAHAERVAAFASALGVERYHLVGHDLGGGIGQIVAVRHAQTLRSLALVNSVGYAFWPVQPITALRAPIVRQLLMATLDAGAFKLVVRRGVHHKDRVTPALMERFRRPLADKAGRKAFLHFARCLDNRDLTTLAGALRELAIQTLIVRGDGDAYLAPSIAETLHADIPGSELARIDTAGHFIQEDEPEWLAATLGRFLTRPDEPDGPH